MVYVKDTFSKDQYEASLRELWVAIWEQLMDLSKPELMAKALSRHFSAQEAEEIMSAANDPTYKQKLLNNTQRALDLGAFGAPWFWVTNYKGKSEPFFGSDRYIYFLRIPPS
jgi:glutathione S-transferase kappa 1